jgi:hypothetical protein
LLGNHLVGVDIDAIERHDEAVMGGEGLHG